MIIDKLGEYSDRQVLNTGTSTTPPSTNTIDHGVVNRNLGTGRQLFLVFSVPAVTTAGDGTSTLSLALTTDNVDTFNDAKETIAAYTFPTGAANYAAGRRRVVPIPPGVRFKRYSRVEYAISGSPAQVITVDCHLTDQEPYDHTTYPAVV